MRRRPGRAARSAASRPGGVLLAGAFGVVHVQLVGAARQRTVFQLAVFDAVHVHHLAVVAGREHFVGCLDVGARQAALLHLDAVGLEQRQHAAARDAVQEGAVVHRGRDHAVLGDPQIAGGELGDVAGAVQHDGVVEALVHRLADGALAVGVETRSLGVGRRHVGPRAREAGEAGGKALFARHRHLEDVQHELGLVGVGQQEAVGAEEHRLDVELAAFGELGHGLQAQRLDFLPRNLRLHQHLFGRAHHALAVQVEVGRQAAERARAVEDHAGHPEGVVGGAEQFGVFRGPVTVVPEQGVHDGFPSGVSGGATMAPKRQDT